MAAPTDAKSLTANANVHDVTNTTRMYGETATGTDRGYFTVDDLEGQMPAFWIGEKHRTFRFSDYNMTFASSEANAVSSKAANQTAWGNILTDVASASLSNSKPGVIYAGPESGGGYVAFNDTLVVPDYCQFHCPDVEIVSDMSSRTKPAITIGCSASNNHQYAVHDIGMVSGYINNSDTHLWSDDHGGACDWDRYAGVRLRNMSHSTVRIKRTQWFAIGVQLFPESSAGLDTVSYGRLYVNRIVGSRYGVEFRGNTGADPGWVNQHVVNVNSFFRSSTAKDFFASCWAYRTTREATGYSGQNALTLLDASIEYGNWRDWEAVMTVEAGNYFQHGGHEYVAKAQLVNPSAPTHTDGSTVSNIQHVDFMNTGALVVDDAGENIELDVSRREGGYGWPVWIRDSSGSASIGSDIRYRELLNTAITDAEVHPTDAIGGIVQKTPQLHFVGAEAIRHYTTNSQAVAVRDYAITDLHLRTIVGTDNTTVQGAPMLYYRNAASTDPSLYTSWDQADVRICAQGARFGNQYGVPVMVLPVTNNVTNFAFMAVTSDGSHRPQVWPLESDFTTFTAKNLTPETISASAGPYWPVDTFIKPGNDIWQWWYIKVNRPDLVKYLAVEWAGGSRVLHSMHARAYGFGQYPGDMVNDIVVGQSLDGPRVSEDTPTQGIFRAGGEFIADITAPAEGWVVKTPGALAPAYADEAVVYKGELRNDGSDVYSADEAHTCDGTAMSNDITNGNGWTLYSDIAVLTATTSTSASTAADISEMVTDFNTLRTALINAQVIK